MARPAVKVRGGGPTLPQGIPFTATIVERGDGMLVIIFSFLYVLIMHLLCFVTDLSVCF